MDKKTKTQQSRIAAILREAILSGKIQSNERLIEMELAKKFSVSRTPIRGAIRELEESGWVKTEKNRGAIVVAISQKEVADLFAVRANLEAFAAEEACKKATNEEVEKLNIICMQMEECDPEDNVKLRELNMLFHKELCNTSDNSILIKLIEDLWERSRFFRQSVWYPPARWKESIIDHREIVEAMKRRNASKVKEVMLHHITYRIGLINERELQID